MYTIHEYGDMIADDGRIEGGEATLALAGAGIGQDGAAVRIEAGDGVVDTGTGWRVGVEAVVGERRCRHSQH